MMRMAIAAGLLLSVAGSGLAGCGDVTRVDSDASAGSDVDAEPVDAAGQIDGSNDASARRCDPDDPISQLRSIEELNLQSFQCCTILTGDGTAYFASSATLDYHLGDIYRATVEEGGMFSDPFPVIGA